MSKFIRNYSENTKNVSKIFQKDTLWSCNKEHDDNFKKLKKLISSPPVHKLYDINTDVKLQVDASSTALEAVLLQEGQPIAYASKSLTESETRYPQIEKKAVAIRFACRRFHEYVHG